MSESRNEEKFKKNDSNKVHSGSEASHHSQEEPSNVPVKQRIQPEYIKRQRDESSDQSQSRTPSSNSSKEKNVIKESPIPNGEPLTFVAAGNGSSIFSGIDSQKGRVIKEGKVPQPKTRFEVIKKPDNKDMIKKKSTTTFEVYEYSAHRDAHRSKPTDFASGSSLASRIQKKPKKSNSGQSLDIRLRIIKKHHNY